MKKTANKNVWLGILAILLVFGMMIIGCGGDPDPEDGGKTIHLVAQHWGYNDDGDCGEQWLLYDKIKLSDLTMLR